MVQEEPKGSKVKKKSGMLFSDEKTTITHVARTFTTDVFLKYFSSDAGDVTDVIFI